MFHEVTETEMNALKRSDAAWVEPSSDFIARAKSQFGISYDATTGFFSYGGNDGIKDLTTWDVAWMMTVNGRAICDSCYTNDTRVRIITQVGNRTGLWPLTSLNAAFSNCTKLEVIDIGNTMSADTVFRSFLDNPKLRRIGFGNAYLNVGKWVGYGTLNTGAETFDGCPNLEHVYIKSLRSNISFRQCPKLDLDSVRYMVDNAANTTPVIAWVHPDIYAKLTDESNAEWWAVNEVAKARDIQFAVE